MTTPTERAGVWTGSNGFRLMPSDPFAEAPATATVSTAAGGNLAVVAYSWTHPDDGLQDGLLVVGPADEAETDAVTAFWGDSWHQSPAPRLCTGTVDGAVVTVGYDYATQWRWEIVVDLTDPDTLRLRMDNVVPDDVADEATPAGPYPAMVMELHRSTT